MGYFDDIKTKQDTPALRVVHAPPVFVGDIKPYAAAALRAEANEVANAPEGTRNDALNRAAFRMGRHIGAGSIDRTTVYEALEHAARSCGLPQHEIDLVLRDDSTSAIDQGATLPRHPDPTYTPETPVVTILTDPETGEVTELAGPPLNPIIDWHELFASEDEGEEWIIEPLLPARRMVALYSAPKAGKSLLMLEVAVGIARGTEVIGVTPDRPRRILYVDFENDPRGDVRARLEAMEIGPGELDNLCYLTYPSLAKFDTQQGALDLLRHVQHYDCEVVVIDTLSRAVAGEENDNNTWLAFYRHTGLLLKQHGIACIRLDHSGKDAEKGMRGGSAKSGDVDAVWRLRPIGEDTVVLECTDNRMLVPVKLLTLTRQEFPLLHKVANEGWKAESDARAVEADRLLDGLGVPSSASVRDAKKALRSAGHKITNKAVEDAVKVRKLRLDIPSAGVPRDAPGHSGTVGGSVPRDTPHVVGVRDTPDGRPGTGRDTAPKPTAGKADSSDPEDPDTLVSCKSCFRPTTQGVASRQGGLCATCHRNSGGAA